MRGGIIQVTKYSAQKSGGLDLHTEGIIMVHNIELYYTIYWTHKKTRHKPGKPVALPVLFAVLLLYLSSSTYRSAEWISPSHRDGPPSSRGRGCRWTAPVWRGGRCRQRRGFLCWDRRERRSQPWSPLCWDICERSPPPEREERGIWGRKQVF